MLGNNKSIFELLVSECFHIVRCDVKITGNYKGGCLRRPRAARRMLPAASTVRSASPASRARRGFTFRGNCQPRGRCGKTENACWWKREPQPYPQQQDVLCSSPSGPAEDPPWNLTGIAYKLKIFQNFVILRLTSRWALLVLEFQLLEPRLGPAHQCQSWKNWS